MNSDEERVRRALRHHVEGIRPGNGSWGQIQRRVDEARRRRRHRVAGGTVGAVAAAVLLVVAVASLGGSGSQVVQTGPASTGAAAPSTAPGPPPDAPPPAPDGPPPTVVPGIWPFHTVAGLEAYLDSDDTRYHDPVDVARAFAVEYLGMADPVVGGRGGGGSAVEVVLRPRGEAGQPLPAGVMDTTVVLISLRGDDPSGPLGPWNVTSATSSNIRLDNGSLRNAAGSPIAIAGEASADEGTVQVEVRQAGMEAGEALGRDVVTAGTSGSLAPFSAEVAFDSPSTEGFGALVLFTESAVDGSTLAATVVGLNIGSSSGSPSAAAPPGEMEVTIFLGRAGEPAASIEDVESVPVTRRVPASAGVLRATLEQLLAGPTEGERARGLTSWFSEQTAGLLEGVTLDGDGTAVVDFGDLPEVIPNASTSAGSVQLLAQLHASVFQFPTVERVEYRLEGSCEAFWTWLQRGCEVVERPGGG